MKSRSKTVLLTLSAVLLLVLDGCLSAWTNTLLQTKYVPYFYDYTLIAHTGLIVVVTLLALAALRANFLLFPKTRKAKNGYIAAGFALILLFHACWTVALFSPLPLMWLYNGCLEAARGNLLFVLAGALLYAGFSARKN